MWSNVGIHGDEIEPHREGKALGTDAMIQVPDEHQGERGNVAAN